MSDGSSRSATVGERGQEAPPSLAATGGCLRPPTGAVRATDGKSEGSSRAMGAHHIMNNEGVSDLGGPPPPRRASREERGGEATVGALCARLRPVPLRRRAAADGESGGAQRHPRGSRSTDSRWQAGRPVEKG